MSKHEMIRFFVPGEPVAKGRPRFALVAGKGRVYTPAKTRIWEARVAEAAIREMQSLGLGRPVAEKGDLASVDLTFYLSKPKTAKREDPTVKPDLDNLTKAVLDGLTQACVWVDDAQVIRLDAEKFYAPEGRNRGPGVLVLVTIENGS